jgi:signal transduction histidine kinase
VNNDELMATGSPSTRDRIVDDGHDEGATSSRFDAPIRYSDVRRPFNTMRALGAIGLAAGAAYGWSQGFGASPWVMLAAMIVATDAVIRRSSGKHALPLILVDTSAIGFALLMRGNTPSISSVAVAYLITASLLLLGFRRAGGSAVFVAMWGAAVWWLSPVVNDGTVPTGTQEILIEVLTVLVFLAVMVQLLVSTRHALFRAAEVQREALATERRAGELKNEFVSMVSHELRTPLTSIAGFADTLRDSWMNLDDSEVEEFLSIIRGETSHLSNLVEDILVIPRLEAGHLRLEPTDLDLRNETFATAQLVFQRSSTEFSVAVAGGVVVHADPIRLTQVLRNLLENANKYGGDQVLVEGEASADLYVVSVSDNGPGVPERHRERIFDHFEQLTKGDSRSDQGVGLGLPIARTLVRAMGGDLWYEDRFPTGSRFRFTVPLSRMVHTLESPPEADPRVA